MDHSWSSSEYASSSAEIFLCSTYKPHFFWGFLLNFASGLLWQRSGHPIIFVAQGLKLSPGESKTSKSLTNFDYCLCSSCRAQFLSDLFYI